MIQIPENKTLCSGCGACFLICPCNAIEMKDDELGFKYPEVNIEKCVKCGKCINSCPKNSDTYEQNWEIYAIKHKSDDVRYNSSSGGAFTLFSDYFLKNKGYVYGVSFDENMNVVHSCASTEAERNKQRGSKYIQSPAFIQFTNVKAKLDSLEPVFFSGTPCQVAGLKAFLGKEYDNLFVCDLICHGVTSPKIWNDFLEFAKSKYGEIAHYLFRDKENGWGYSGSIITKKGKKVNTPASNIMKDLFVSDICLRTSCYHCDFSSTNRCSDITIADFWGIEKKHLEFKDNLGVSIIKLNTQKGKSLFEKTKQDCDYIKIDIDDVEQPNLHTPTEHNDLTEKFCYDYLQNSFTYISKKYFKYDYISRIKFYVFKFLKKTHLFDFVLKIYLKMFNKN